MGLPGWLPAIKGMVTMHPELLALCRQRITIEPYLESDRFGTSIYGQGGEYPARVVGEVKMVRATTGEEMVSSTKVTIPGPPHGPASIDPRSRITLPDGSAPPILAMGTHPDEEGRLHHYTLRLA